MEKIIFISRFEPVKILVVVSTWELVPQNGSSCEKPAWVELRYHQWSTIRMSLVYKNVGSMTCLKREC